ncbi:Uncharacterised protein [BD1-7 clade bacterium]|uniref:Uncharacterized protein n=1 Tax=BD1-7 clade bacterium TaxID=2029982 RepID=A0A5S9P704_9GAMM|nr:Uncharacterised protein [BD1-7 clade bacterium]CAA0099360.1 Uncharacterised protein [BD1-7 clade bacterium]
MRALYAKSTLLFTSLASLASVISISPALAEPESNTYCRAPKNLESQKIIYSAMTAVNNPQSRFQLIPGQLYTGTYSNDTFTFVEADSPQSISEGSYQYVNRADVGIIRGEFIASDDQRISFTLALTCRTDNSGIYSYTARDNRQAPASLGRYLLK